jgi:succinate dehydrogenase / fumarate reductase cytochrome b subunit
MELIDPQSGYKDVYRMVVMVFEDPVNAVGYILMMAFLCLHLSHGIAAMFSSLGLKNQVYECRIKRLAQIVASVLFVGYSAVPLSILLGLVKR